MKVDWDLDWVKLQAELSYQKVIDSVNFAETYAASVGKNLFDEVILSDSVIKYIITDYDDTVPLNDVFSTLNEFLRDRFDEVRASDLQSAGLLNASLVNEFLLNNAISTDSQVAITPVSTDLTTMSDTLAAVTSTTKTDLTTISDVLAAVTNKLFSDTASTSDVTTSNISKYLASGISLDDFADINKSVNGVKGNIAVMGDTISVSLILSRMLGSRLINEITLN